MSKIICISGESGSGKTTIAELLEKRGYNYIESYTTRPMRFQDEEGHIFVDMDKYNEDKKSGNMVAETFFNGNYYWTLKEQYESGEKSVCVMDARGSDDLKQKELNCLCIFLKCDEKTRKNRMYLRKYGYKINNILDFEIENRIEHDRDEFKIVRCDYVVDSNRSIDEVFRCIKTIIGEF